MNFKLTLSLGMNRGTSQKNPVTEFEFDSFVKYTVSRIIQFATISEKKGIFKGAVEKTKCIEVITDNPAEMRRKLIEVGHLYAHAYDQEQILLETEEVEADFIDIKE